MPIFWAGEPVLTAEFQTLERAWYRFYRARGLGDWKARHHARRKALKGRPPC